MTAEYARRIIQYSPHALLAASDAGHLVIETPLSESRLSLPAGTDAYAFVRMLVAAVRQEKPYGELVKHCDKVSRQLVDWLIAHRFLQLIEAASTGAERNDWLGIFRALGGDWQVESAVIWGFPRDANHALERVRNAHIIIYGSGQTAERLQDELEVIGCRHLSVLQGGASVVTPLLADVDLVLFAGIPDDVLSRHDMNRLCIQGCTPWLGIGLHMNRVEVGPLCLPGETPCLACLEGDMAVGFGLAYVENPERRLPRALPGVEIMVMETCRFLAGLETNTHSRIWRWLLASYRTEWLELHKNPACLVCGPGAIRERTGSG